MSRPRLVGVDGKRRRDRRSPRWGAGVLEPGCASGSRQPCIDATSGKRTGAGGYIVRAVWAGERPSLPSAEGAMVR